MTGCDHKVIVVLDHGSRFAAPSNNDIPVSLKDRSSTVQVAMAKKSVWTWSIECVLEYYRIVSDLFFDNGRLFRMTVADTAGKMLNPSWEPKLMSYPALTDVIKSVGPPIIGGEDCIPVAGLVLAVEALSQKTIQQEEKIQKLKARKQTVNNTNSGSIIVFCTIKSETELEELQNTVLNQIKLTKKNIASSGTEQALPIDKLDLYIINTYPQNQKPAVTSSQRQQLTSKLSCTVMNSPAGESLISAIHSTCLSIYDLVSTTVSGIPMKEESHQGQSVNYDVELFHPRAAHSVLERLKLCGEGGFLQDKSRSLPYPTYKLGWSTPSPKNKWNLFPKTLTALRVTPSAVNSRPSVCLTTFVTSGRNVMLEVTRTGPAESIKPNVNQKLISHTLISHLGRLYIHSIDIIPENMQLNEKFSWPTSFADCGDSDEDEDEEVEPCDVPTKPVDFDDESVDVLETSTVEGTLRIEEFCILMKECMLRPRQSTEPIPPQLEGVPCGQAVRHIRQLTRYFPLTLEESLIFQCGGKFDELINVFRKQKLEVSDVATGRKNIFSALALKTAKEALFKKQIKCSLFDDPKDMKNRDEVDRIAFIELASYLSNFANNSEAHSDLFKELMDTLEVDKYITISFEDVPVNYDELPNTEDFVVENPASAPPTAHSSRSNSPVPQKKPKKFDVGEAIDVFKLLTSLAPKIPSRPDFVGREEAGDQPAKLYKNLDLTTALPKGHENPI